MLSEHYFGAAQSNESNFQRFSNPLQFIIDKKSSTIVWSTGTC